MHCRLIVGLFALAAPAQTPPPSTPAPPPAASPAPKPSDTPGVGLQSKVAPGQPLGMSAARVGNEEVSLFELKNAYKAWKKDIPPGQALSPEDQYMMTRQLLEGLIDRTLIVQEARRALKDQKHWDMFLKFVDDNWTKKDLPHLLNRYDAADLAELRHKMEKKGESLDELRTQKRMEEAAREYLAMQVRPKITPQLQQMKEYYRKHQKEFDAPAYVTWRELSVSVDEKTPRAQARKKADAWLARLSRGEDFAKIARAESGGATAAKGGLWDKMRPGSYKVPAVNSALERLSVNQVSPIVEGPESFHILVVESRRAAGPLPFEDVQDKVAEILFHQSYKREVEALLTRLRSRTVITTVFDAPPTDPAVNRASAKPSR